MPRGTPQLDLDREALLAQAAFYCELVTRARLAGYWMPKPHIGLPDKLYIITGGRARLTLDNHVYALEPGQVVIVPAGTVQQGTPDAKAPLEKTYAHFAALTSSIPHLLRLAPPPLCVAGDAAAEIAEIGRELEHEWDNPRPGRQLALKMLLTRALLVAYRADPRDHVEPVQRDADIALKAAGARSAVTEDQILRVRAAIAAMTSRLDEPLTLADLAARAHLTPPYFSRLFKRVVGDSPMKFLELIRMRRAQALLAGSNLPIREIAEQVGYRDPNYFSRAFQRFARTSATDYREAAQLTGPPSGDPGP